MRFVCLTGASLLLTPLPVEAQLPGIPVLYPWGWGPGVAVDYAKVAEDQTASAVGVSLGYRAENWWSGMLRLGMYVPSDSSPSLRAVGALVGWTFFQAGGGYAAGDGERRVNWLVSIPLIGLGCTRSNLALWGFVHGVVSGERRSAAGISDTEWSGHVVGQIQGEFPNGLGGRLGVSFGGPFNADDLTDVRISLGFHYSFRSVTRIPSRYGCAP